MSHGNFIEKAKEIIKRNPEYFEALVEYEKTGRLPKFKYKKRVNFTIDSDLLKRFRLYCQGHSMKMSTKIEQLIKDEVIENK